MNDSKTPWYDKPGLLGLLLLVLPLIGLVGAYLSKAIPKSLKVLLIMAATINFLGQISVLLLYFSQKG